MAPIMIAVENRLKVGVVVVAGLNFQHALPEVDEVNYAPRVEIPILMLNGKYDFFFPYETSQVPFYELLGTPAEHKKLVVHEDRTRVSPNRASQRDARMAGQIPRAGRILAAHSLVMPTLSRLLLVLPNSGTQILRPRDEYSLSPAVLSTPTFWNFVPEFSPPGLR